MLRGQPKKLKIQGDKLPEEQIKILKSIELEIKNTSLFLKKNIKGEQSEKVESEEESETPLIDIKDAIIKTSSNFSKSFSKVANTITEINKNILSLVNDKKEKEKNNTPVEKPSLSSESSEEQETIENEKLELVKKQTTTLQDIKDILENKFSGGSGGSAKGGGIGDMLGGIASMIRGTAFGGIMATILGVVGAGAAVLVTAAVAGGLGFAAYKYLLEPWMDKVQARKNKVYAEKENAKIKDILTDTGERVYNVEGDTPEDERVMSEGQIQLKLQDSKTSKKDRARLENALASGPLKVKTDANDITTGGRRDIKSGTSIGQMGEDSANDAAGRKRDPKAYEYKSMLDQVVLFDEKTRQDWEAKRKDPDSGDLGELVKKYRTAAIPLLASIDASKILDKDQKEYLKSLSPILRELGNDTMPARLRGMTMPNEEMDRLAAREEQKEEYIEGDGTTTGRKGYWKGAQQGQNKDLARRYAMLQDMGKAEQEKANSGKKPSNTPQPKAPITAGAEGDGALIGAAAPSATPSAAPSAAPVLKTNTSGKDYRPIKPDGSRADGTSEEWAEAFRKKAEETDESIEKRVREHFSSAEFKDLSDDDREEKIAEIIEKIKGDRQFASYGLTGGQIRNGEVINPETGKPYSYGGMGNGPAMELLQQGKSPGGSMFDGQQFGPNSHKNEAIYEGSPQGSKVIVGEDNASEVILSTNPNKITRQIAENLRQSMGGSDTSSTEKSSSVILDALQNSLAEYVEMFKISPLQGNQQGNQTINNTVVSGGGGGGGVNAQYNPSMMDTSNSENILQELLKNSYRAALL